MVVARYPGGEITRDQLLGELKYWLLEYDELTLKKRPVLDYLQKKVLFDLLIRKRVQQEIEKEKFQLSAEEMKTHETFMAGVKTENKLPKSLVKLGLSFESWQERILEDFKIQKFVDHKVSDQIQVSDKELALAFKERSLGRSFPVQVRARQILVQHEELAQELLGRLKKKEATFEELAQKYSLSVDSEKGGDLGFYSQRQLIPEFDRTFKMNVGQLSPVFKSPYGYHILKVVEKRGGKNVTFPQVRERLRQQLVLEKREKAHQAWLQNFLQDTKIWVHPLFLKARPHPPTKGMD